MFFKKNESKIEPSYSPPLIGETKCVYSYIENNITADICRKVDVNGAPTKECREQTLKSLKLQQDSNEYKDSTKKNEGITPHW